MIFENVMQFVHVFLVSSQIDPSVHDMFEEKEVDENEQKDSTWSWQEYFDEYEAAYACCRQEEEDFRIAYYDENDFDPALFINASLDWIPR